MTCTLFPDFQARVNPLSAGNRKRVDDLYNLLESAREAGHIPGRFYAITDSDSDSSLKTVPRVFRWDRYHIENYLLEPQFIIAVLQDLLAERCSFRSAAEVDVALQTTAKLTISGLVAHRLRSVTNSALIESINLGFDPNVADIARALADAAERSRARIDAAVASTVGYSELSQLQEEYTREATDQILDGSWKLRFRGRDVLKRFTATHGCGLQYEVVRNAIVAKMRDNAFQPSGMLAVTEKILSEST